MRRADFCRAEQTRRRRVAQTPKLSQDGFEAEGDVPGDVFKEDPFGVAFSDDSGDIGPEMPGVVGTSTLSGCAEGLAGISGEDDVEGAAEGTGIEAAKIIPNRGWSEISGALCRNEAVAGILLPFDIGTGVEAGFGEHEAHIEATTS